jgi:hypothetical protein
MTTNNPSNESVDDDAERGSRWVDMSEMSPDARIALGGKKLGDEVVVIRDLTKV